MTQRFGISTIGYLYINQNPKMEILKIFFQNFAKPEITESCLLIPYYFNINIFIVRENEISTHFPPQTMWQKFFRFLSHLRSAKTVKILEE